MESLNLAYRILYTLTLLGFAAGLTAALIRSVKGPEICDRIEARVREEAWRLSPQRAQRPAAAPVTAPVDIVAEDFDQG